MARTIQQIHQDILDKIAATPELAGLNNPSQVGIIRLIARVVAACIWTVETLLDRHKADVDAALAAAKPGTPEWYALMVKKFQQGDSLVVDNKGIYYPDGSTGLKLVFQSAAIENDQTGKLFLKVAAADPAAAGGLRSLTDAEKTQVTGYMARIKWAGTNIEVVSRDADFLKVVGVIYYDPLLEVATVQTAVKAALVGYLQNLSFDGQVFRARIEDAIQLAAGVKDLELTSVSARSGNAPSVAVTRVYPTEAGYIVEDDAAGSGFLDTLSFLPYAN